MEKTMKMTIIEPNWEKSPAWAGWWAVNRDRLPEGDVIWASWYENEPKFNSGIWVSTRGRSREDSAWSSVDWEIEWDKNLRSRP